MKLGLVTLVLSVAALIGLAYNQHLYREAIRKINELDKKRPVNDHSNKQPLPHSLNNSISGQVSITKKPVSSSDLQPVDNTIAQKTQQSNPEMERFYTIFKDAMNRYEKEMREKYSRDSKKYMNNRLNRYKKRLDINDMQWQFVEPILTDYLQKLDQLRTGLFPEIEDDSEDYWQKLQALKDEYAKKLAGYLTNQQVDDFKNILIQ